MGPSLWILHLTRWLILLLADCSENCSGSGRFLPLYRGNDVEHVFLIGMHEPHLRQQLLVGLTQTDEDQRWDKQFKAVAGDIPSYSFGRGAAHYLDALANRAVN